MDDRAFHTPQARGPALEHGLVLVVADQEYRSVTEMIAEMERKQIASDQQIPKALRLVDLEQLLDWVGPYLNEKSQDVMR